MMAAKEQKVQKLLDLLEEHRIIALRMMATCEQMEKALRGELNDELPPSA